MINFSSIAVSFVFAILAVLLLALCFIPLEKVFPAKPEQRVLRAHWLTDLWFLVGQYVIWGGLVLIALHLFSEWLDGIVPLKFRSVIAAQPVWLQAIEIVVVSDICIYWAHRLQHSVNFLWRFHKIHHSSEHLDWLAAHREHPVDTIYTVGIINLPAFVAGFDLTAIALVIAFRGIWAIYIHSNTRIPLGPLRMLIGSPELHHWHHDIERDRGNYANVSPLMDKIFGTYTCPDHEPEQVGISEELPKSYTGLLIAPLKGSRNR